MNIKIKVKHLVLLVLLPLTLLGTGLALRFTAASTAADVPPSSAVQTMEREELLAELASSTGTKRMELIRSKVIDPGITGSPYHFDVYIGSGSSQWSDGSEGTASPLLPEDKIALLKEYVLEGPSDYALPNAVKQLVYELDTAGKGSEADALIAAAAERVSSNSQLGGQLTLLRAGRALNSGDLALASRLTPDAAWTGDMELLAEAAWLRGRVLFAAGKSSEALKLVGEALVSYRGQQAAFEASVSPGAAGDATDSGAGTAAPEHSSPAEDKLTALQTAMRQAAGMGLLGSARIEGTLQRSDGTPVARAGVFLRAESEIYHSVHYGDEPYQTVTDENGHYSFSNVIPGFYQLQLGLSFEQIDGWTWPAGSDEWLELDQGAQLTEDITLQPLLELKSPVNSEVVTGPSVTFEWEPVQSAAYYKLWGGVSSEGSSYSVPIHQYIQDTETTVSAEQLYSASGFSTTSSYTAESRFPDPDDPDSWQATDPSSLLSFADPESRFSWYIEAYDADGNVITRSNGYRLNEDTVGNLPFFYYKERTLTAADRLVKERKLAEAVEAYRQDVAADPQDSHALKMLVHLLLAKSSRTKDPQVEEEAIRLLVKLVELQPARESAGYLSYHYYKQADWENYNRYYDVFLSQVPDQPGRYPDSTHASALMFQGQTEAALEAFAADTAADRSHRYIGSYLAAELQAGASLEAALELAQRYPEHSYGHSGYRWPLLLQELQAERAADPASFDRELQARLDQYWGGQKEAVQQWAEAGEPSALKSFMTAVLEVN
ncbi:hypothetical protein [Paenibacillus tengchongensis]|uniref:hypothetical protein n=1 Tax=Paenibacillus tengchongensis TaxID=2608684 RepID=UPI00124D4C20|nr:hypothetical protein [Paenibacillus tengchongensis]